MLRRIFGPQRNEVTGEWRRLNNEELIDLYYTTYYLGDQIRKNEMGGGCSTYGGMGEVHIGMLWGDRREEITWKTQVLMGG